MKAGGPLAEAVPDEELQSGPDANDRPHPPPGHEVALVPPGSGSVVQSQAPNDRPSGAHTWYPLHPATPAQPID